MTQQQVGALSAYTIMHWAFVNIGAYKKEQLLLKVPPGGSEWIISVGDYVDNLFPALGSSDPREVRLEL